MARYRGVTGSRYGLKIILMFLLILILISFAIVLFNFLGLLNLKKVGKVISAHDTGLDLVGIELLDSERLIKNWESLEKWQSELNAKSDELVLKDRDIQEQLDAITENKQALEDEKKSFEDSKITYQTKEDKILTITNDFLSMKPEIAVKGLEKMSDQDIIEILKAADKIAEEKSQASMGSVWLSQMDPERVAVINRKRLQKDF